MLPDTQIDSISSTPGQLADLSNDDKKALLDRLRESRDVSGLVDDLEDTTLGIKLPGLAAKAVILLRTMLQVQDINLALALRVLSNSPDAS